MLTGEQHSLLAYQIFRDEVMEGGFCQLIQNGYGGYIFDNPFAKVMRLWGVGDLSKLVYAAKKIYDSHRDDLERERTDEEFMAMYEQYEAFDELEDEFLEKEEEYTALVAGYVDEHLELFAKIVIESNEERHISLYPFFAFRYWRDVLSESQKICELWNARMKNGINLLMILVLFISCVQEKEDNNVLRRGSVYGIISR